MRKRGEREEVEGRTFQSMVDVGKGFRDTSLCFVFFVVYLIKFSALMLWHTSNDDTFVYSIWFLIKMFIELHSLSSLNLQAQMWQSKNLMTRQFFIFFLAAKETLSFVCREILANEQIVSEFFAINFIFIDRFSLSHFDLHELRLLSDTGSCFLSKCETSKILIGNLFCVSIKKKTRSNVKHF